MEGLWGWVGGWLGEGCGLEQFSEENGRDHLQSQRAGSLICDSQSPVDMGAPVAMMELCAFLQRQRRVEAGHGMR